MANIISPKNPEKALIVKFGGSQTINETGVDDEYIEKFFKAFASIILSEFTKTAFVIGGGEKTRKLQENVPTEEKDQVGIETTQEHARELIEIMLNLNLDSNFSINQTVPTSIEEAEKVFKENKEFALVLAGLKVGRSTDATAMTLARLFQEQDYEPQIVILSNVLHIFAKDPTIDSKAIGIKNASIKQLIELGVFSNDPSSFTPGMKTPIDPKAVEMLEKLEPQPPLFFGHAEMFQNVKKFLLGEEPNGGTIITPYENQVQYYEKSTKDSRVGV